MASFGEDELRQGMELLFYGYRDFTGDADAVLEQLGLGRAHHRAIYFIGRNPRIPVSDLLGILRITKQSFSRVLQRLLSEGYVVQAAGITDRRQRQLMLTEKGQALERRLTETQTARLGAAYQAAGAAAVEGFRQVLRGLSDPEAR